MVNTLLCFKQGLIQAISDNFAQPSLSLVSHGAECILLHKKFFLEMAPLKLLDKLREEVSTITFLVK